MLRRLGKHPSECISEGVSRDDWHMGQKHSVEDLTVDNITLQVRDLDERERKKTVWAPISSLPPS